MSVRKNLLLFLSLAGLVLLAGCVSNPFSNQNNPQKPEFEKSQVPYQKVSDLAEVNGKLAYKAENETDEFIVYKGEKLGSNYLTVGSPRQVNDKLVFSAADSYSHFIVVDSSPQAEFDLIRSIKEINGNLAYLAKEGDQKYLVLGGKKTKIEYNAVQLYEVAGKPVYIVRKPEKEYLVIDEKETEKYDSVGVPKEVNGKVAYVAYQGNQSFVVYDGRKIGQEYDKIRGLTEVKNELAYRVIDEGRTFLIKGDKVISDKYKIDPSIHRFEVQGSNQAVTARGKPVFRVWQTPQEFLIKGKNRSKRHNIVFGLKEVQGNLAFIAVDYVNNNRDKRVERIIYQEHEGEPFDKVTIPVEVNNKLVYGAKKNSTWYLVQEK